MTTARAGSRSSSGRRVRRWRRPLMVLAGVRAALSLLAVPLAPALYEDHFVLLVLLRPTKEVLLAGGFLVRRGEVDLLVLLLATVPLMVFGVWHFFFLGRAYKKEIVAGDVPGLGGRLLPAKRIAAIRKVLGKKGPKLVVLGRLAVLPSSLVAAAAGASTMPTRTFLVADGVGGLLSVVEVVGAGLLLGEAYKEAGPWLTAVGVAVLLAMLWLFGRYLKRL
ncbi:MAG TPA: VTT domain-containing protein [Mycobacteriales bacterium]|nr:VTT domain-containing protein [Mycobacteriales bacterium]